MRDKELNLFTVLYEHGPSENELTQVLSYFLQTDKNFLDAFVARIDAGYLLNKPTVRTQESLEEGVPDLVITDENERIRLLVEVKVDARETGGDQLKRYAKSLEKFSKEKPDWKASLVLLSKRRMDELSSQCHEMLWYDVYEILGNLKERIELEDQFIKFMEVIGLANKPVQFGGISKDDIYELQKFGNILEGLKELRNKLMKNLESKLKVSSTWRLVNARGVQLLKGTGNGYSVFIDLYWGPATPSPDEYDKLMGLDSPCFFVNIAFTISENNKLRETLASRGFFTSKRYAPYIQKAFKIESLGREKQIAEILKIVNENIPELG